MIESKPSMLMRCFTNSESMAYTATGSTSSFPYVPLAVVHSCSFPAGNAIRVKSSSFVRSDAEIVAVVVGVWVGRGIFSSAFNSSTALGVVAEARGNIAFASFSVFPALT